MSQVPLTRKLAVTFTVEVATSSDDVLCFDVAEAMALFIAEPAVVNGCDNARARYAINGRDFFCASTYVNRYEDPEGREVIP